MISGPFDLIALDPPHAALLSMLFGGLLAKLVDTMTDDNTWLVIYQGHTSQSGRGETLVSAVQTLLKNHQVIKFIVNSEEIIVCGPARNFDDVMSKVENDLRHAFTVDILRVERRTTSQDP